MQLLHAIPKSWKNDLSDVKENIDNLVIQDHHMIRKHHMYKEIHNFLSLKKNKLHQDYIINLLVCIVTKGSKLRAFQFKLLNNVLNLNKRFFKFGKSGSPLCSFCSLKNEIPYHLF